MTEEASTKLRIRTSGRKSGRIRQDLGQEKLKVRGLNDPEKAERISRIDALVGGEPVRPRVFVESEPEAALERVIVDATSVVARDSFLLGRGVDPAALDAAVAESGPVVVAGDPPDPQAGQRLGPVAQARGRQAVGVAQVVQGGQSLPADGADL